MPAPAPSSSSPPTPPPAPAGRPDIFTVIVGTAGHIDHGKSTLVRALTGIDPDRLPEEKDREMTIDLGFAPLRLPDGRTVGVIDVPGHERFVKNMVAGATGIDVGLLVVDANEGVMPQTREHVEIMQLLGIRTGLCALTKTDTAGPEMTALAAEDLGGFLAGTFLEKAPILPVSSLTGEGIDALRAAIARACVAAGPRRAAGPFRMPIQRVFSAQGFGTVVTGVPVSGRVRPGDAVEVLPLGRTGKVRGIQAYMADAAEARAGHSSALNVADIERGEVVRGMVVAEPGAFEGATLLEARLTHLAGARRRALRHLATVRVHVGTAEAIGEVALLEGRELAPGASGLVQLRLREPVVVAPGDRFIIRRHEESRTLGGGVVLGTGAHRLKAGKAFVVEALRRKEEALADPSRVRVLEEALRAEGATPAAPALLRRRTGLGAEEAARALEALAGERRAAALRRGALWVHADAFEAAKRRLLALVDEVYAKDPLRVHLERAELRALAALEDDLFDAALEALVLARRIERLDAERLRKAGRAVALSEEQEALRADLLALFAKARFQPPSLEEAAAALRLPKKREPEVAKMLRLLVEEKALAAVAPGIWVDAAALEEARALVVEECRRAAAAGEDFAAASIRDRLGTTRKWLIPILEHFDASGLTVRKGSTRVLRNP
jgi:selenocysteine-specific elongation factor